MNNLIDDFKKWAIKENKKFSQKNILLEHQEQILTLLDEGFSIKLIYKYFIENNLITCGYDNFRKHVSNIQKENIRTKDEPIDKDSEESELKNKTAIEKQSQSEIKEESQEPNPKFGDPNWKPKIVKAEIPRFEWNSTPNIDELV